MNRQRIMAIALVSSLAFNVAFCAIWGYHMLYVSPKLAEQAAQKLEPAENAQALPTALERLRLTPEQRRQITVQYADFREQFARALADAQASRDEVLVHLGNPEVRPEVLQVAEHKMADQQERIRQMVLEHLSQMNKALNEDQRREFGQMLRQGPPGQKPRPFMRRPMRPFRPEPQPPGPGKADGPQPQNEPL